MVSSRSSRIRVLVALVIFTNVFGNFLLSRGMRDVGKTVTFSPLPYLEALANPWIAGGVVLLAAWFLSQLFLLSWVDLSYFLPVTSVSYVLTAMLGKFFLAEHVSFLHWTGIGLITLGVAVVGRTTPRTTGNHGPPGAQKK